MSFDLGKPFSVNVTEQSVSGKRAVDVVTQFHNEVQRVENGGKFVANPQAQAADNILAGILGSRIR